MTNKVHVFTASGNNSFLFIGKTGYTYSIFTQGDIVLCRMDILPEYLLLPELLGDMLENSDDFSS